MDIIISYDIGPGPTPSESERGDLRSFLVKKPSSTGPWLLSVWSFEPVVGSKSLLQYCERLQNKEKGGETKFPWKEMLSGMQDSLRAHSLTELPLSTRGYVSCQRINARHSTKNSWKKEFEDKFVLEQNNLRLMCMWES